MLILIVAFLVAIILSSILTVYVRDFASARGWMDHPAGGRHLHLRPVPRLGGVAIFCSFVTISGVSLALPETQALLAPIAESSFYPILGPATLIFLLGLYDDIFGSNAYLKFGVQIIAATWLYFGGIAVHRLDMLFEGEMLRTMIGLPLTIFWVLLITNAFNLIDGLDGLTAGSALFTAMVLCIQSLLSDNPSIAFLAVVLSGAIIGFLRYNFHPATIFLGDCGSLFIGFLISALALAGSQKSTIMVAVAIPVLSCGLPILDLALAVLRRYLNDMPIFGADQDHIHHRLVKRGVSQRNAVLILYATSGGFALLSLALLHGETAVALVVIVAGIGTYAGLRHLNYEEFAELRRVLRQALRQRAIIRNNLSVRRAALALRSCENSEDISRVLMQTLQPLGFSGFEIELVDRPNPRPQARTETGRVQARWSMSESAPEWELKLALTAGESEAIGNLILFRPARADKLLLDINVLSDALQTALADVLHQQSARASISVV